MISLIIPAYNAEDTLEACVRSVMGQEEQDFELILADDGSTDGTGKICDRLAEEDGRIRVIHRENSGPSGARNAGIDIARGEYLCFMDADDEAEPTYLSYLEELMGKDPECRICQANHWVRRGNRETPDAPAGEEIAVLSPREAAEAVLFYDRVNVSGWGKLFHRSVFEKLRFPEGRIFEDTWIFGKMLKQTGSYVYGAKPQYHYIMREGSLTRKAYSAKNLEFIEAAEELAKDLEEIDPGCRVGGIRRVNHARLSVLRYMKNCSEEEKKVRERLREEVLEAAPEYIRDPRTPGRDRAAVELLKVGFWAFYGGWALYSKVRP